MYDKTHIECSSEMNEDEGEPKVHIIHKEEAPARTYNIAEDLIDSVKIVKTKERLNKETETTAARFKKEKLKKKKEKKIVFEKNKKDDYEIAED